MKPKTQFKMFLISFICSLILTIASLVGENYSITAFWTLFSVTSFVMLISSFKKLR